MSTLASRIQEAIDTSGVSVADVAAACGISVQAVYAWTRDGGTKNIEGTNLAELAHLTGFEPRYIMKGVGPRIRAYAKNSQQEHVLRVMQNSAEYSSTLTKIATAINERNDSEMQGTSRNETAA